MNNLDKHTQFVNWQSLGIDGVKLCREDCDWMVMMSNHSGGQTSTLNDLSLPILQHILKQTNKDG